MCVKEKTYSGGIIAFLNARPTDVKIQGKLNRTNYEQLLSVHQDKAFREWIETGYEREKAIPAWARDSGASAPVASEAPLFPSDGDHPSVVQRQTLILDAWRGDEKAIRELLSRSESLPPRTRAYIRGVLYWHRDELLDAEKALDTLVKLEPGFGRGRGVRGLVKFQLRKLDEARADFDVALEKAPADPNGIWGAATLAVLEGDLDRAHRVLQHAKKVGAMDEDLKRLAEIVYRARRGPSWSKRHTKTTEHFVIASNHSERLCRRASSLLEAAFRQFHIHFPELPTPERRARVYIFAGQEGFLRYAANLRRDLTGAAGAYLPSTRELVLFVTLDEGSMEETIRHEGWHCFINQNLDDVPIWFDEGLAEYFGSSRKGSTGRRASGACDSYAVEYLLGNTASWPDLETLFKMDPDTFMAKPEMHYAISWAVIHCLKNAKDSKLRKLPGEYLAALRRGLSQRQAYEEILELCVSKIDAALRAHLKAMKANPGD